MPGFDNELPPIGTAEVLEAIREAPERGAYLFIGSDEEADGGRRAALLVKAEVPKLDVYRVTDKTKVADWLDDPDHIGIVVKRGGASTKSVDKRTAESSYRLKRSFENLL